MATRQININQVATRDIIRVPNVNTNININTESPYANYQVLIILEVTSLVRLTFDNDPNFRDLTPALYFVIIRTVDSISTVKVYEIIPITGEFGEGEDSCFTRCLRSYYVGNFETGRDEDIVLGISIYASTVIGIIGTSTACGITCKIDPNSS